MGVPNASTMAWIFGAQSPLLAPSPGFGRLFLCTALVLGARTMVLSIMAYFIGPHRPPGISNTFFHTPHSSRPIGKIACEALSYRLSVPQIPARGNAGAITRKHRLDKRVVVSVGQ